MDSQSFLGWVLRGRKVHFTESRNFPSASQSSTARTFIPAPDIACEAASQLIAVMIYLYERRVSRP
jgi:hypothetical protein